MSHSLERWTSDGPPSVAEFTPLSDGTVIVDVRSAWFPNQPTRDVMRIAAARQLYRNLRLDGWMTRE